MIAPALLAVAIVAAVFVEMLLPGRAVYHAGWYNVGLASLIILLVMRARKAWRTNDSTRARSGIAVAALGVGIIGFAGVVCGLLAPDARTIVGAPGTSVRVDDLGGALAFPLTSEQAAPRLVRSGSSTAIDRTRDVGAFLLRPIARSVVAVAATDTRGRRLTITQPTGSSFLSPVLLMQEHQTISGLDVPFDSFAVPTAHRIVKAVLFSPEQAAKLRATQMLTPRAAILFAADDDADQPLPNALALVRDGESGAIGGLVLRADVLTYPAID